MSQILKDLNVSVAQVEEVFFIAMLAGYVGNEDVVIQELEGMPGFKSVEFVDGNFRVVDAWCSSSGFTLIWYKDTLVWSMNYGGNYPKEYVSFLKWALQQSYSRAIFYGGRGMPVKDVNQFKQLSYVNIQSANNKFIKFSGKESIFDCEQEVGYHHYFGGLVY